MVQLNDDERQLRSTQVDELLNKRRELEATSSDEELGVGDYLIDVAAAIPRGIESGIKDFYNVVDDATSWVAQKVTGNDEADILPDYEENFLGESKTGVGKAVQSISEWVSVFLPVAGQVGSVAKGASIISKLGKAGKVAEKAAEITGKFGLGTGAIADFVVQQQNEGTLSNMLQDAGFDNALTQFMSVDEDDSVLETKLKAALEGALLGGAVAGVSEKLVSPLIKTIKKNKAISKAISGDVGKEELEKLIQQNVLDDNEAKVVNGFIEDRMKVEETAKSLLKDENLQSAVDVLDDFNFAIRSDDVLAVAKANYKNVVDVNEKLTKTFTTLKDLDSYDHEGFLKLMDEMVELREVASEQGKSLQALKGQAQARKILEQDSKSLLTLKKTVEGLKKKAPEELKELNEFVLSLDSPRELRDFLNQTLSKTPDGMLRKAGMMTQEFWRNALLSGPATHVLNLGSNAFRLSYEKFKLGLTGMFKGDTVMMRQSLVEFRSLFTNAIESSRLAFKAVRRNFNRARPQGIIDDSSAAFIHTAKNQKYVRKWSKAYVGDNVFGIAAEYAGNIMNIPTTMLSATDEMFKQLAVRSKIEGKFFADGVRKGLDGVDLETFIKKNVDSAMLDTGEIASRESLFKRGLEEAKAKGIETTKGRMEFANKYVASADPSITEGMKDDLIEYARKITYQTELKGPIGTSLNKMANEKPLLFGWFLPFIKTPMNVLNAGIREFTPIQTIRDMASGALFSADAAVRAEAQARFAAMTVVTGTVLGVVNNGGLTGSGPKNPNVRNALMQTGWQPYSIKIGDKYISYRRLDPIATPLGLIADLFESYNDGLIEDADASKLLDATMISLMNNFANKSYFQGITNFVRFLTSVGDSEKDSTFFVSNFLGSFVPAFIGNSNGMLSGEDPVVQVRGIFDSMKARLGFDETLEIKRNIMGEELNALDGTSALNRLLIPSKAIKKKQDIVSDEIAKSGLTMGQPSYRMNGVDLREIPVEDGRSAYSQYQDLIRDTKINGKNLRQALQRLVTSSRYKRLPEEQTIDGQESARAAMIKAVISRYRTNAKKKLIKKLPELENKINLKRDLRHQVRKGKVTAREAVLRLLNTK